MKNWQKNRNYKRVKDKDGNVVANIITVFGQDVEVSNEIFTAYIQMDNHARYIMEDAPKGKELSLEQMMEDGAPVETTVYDAVLSAEDIYIAHETEKLRAEQIEQLPLTFEKLSDNERNLVDALFFRGMGVREYAREIGVSHTRVRRERDCILEKLKKYFSKS